MEESRLLVDTNVVSFVMRVRKTTAGSRPDRKADLGRAYAKHLQGKLLAISFITVGELYYGAKKAKWGPEKCSKLETTLKNFVVLPYDYLIAQYYASVMVAVESEGRTIDDHDAWIAACALRHDISFVTHNPKHFVGIPNLKIITECPNDASNSSVPP